jgi:hypothetical protein
VVVLTCTVMCGFVCMCGFCNVFDVCMYGFCNVLVCECVGFVMCGCYDNCVGVLVICVLVFTVFLYCLYCVFVLFLLCIFIRFVCTSVRTTATECQLDCSE